MKGERSRSLLHVGRWSPSSHHCRPGTGLDAQAHSRGGRLEKCFVAMPFAPAFYDIFHYGIQPVVEGQGVRCVRIDRDVFVGDVTSRIHEQIDAADVVIADMSGANPNVYYEVGYAQRANKPTILICAANLALAFNVRGVRCLFYQHIADLERQLSHELAGLLQAAAAWDSASAVTKTSYGVERV